VFNALLDDAQWEAYVARMRRMPGSGISPADGERVLRFLLWRNERLRGSSRDVEAAR
jgi:hypothetical protein